MIDEIIIKGFQSHLDSDLKFHKGINIISGSSNTGKSSVLKALNWLLKNEPVGSEFINKKSKICQVTLKNGNDIIEKRKTKDGKLNSYIINGVKNDSGKNVPLFIQKLLKFSDLNIQKQFDKFFLLQDSAGDITRKLNKIIDLEIIDSVIKKSKSEVNEKKKDIIYIENKVADLKNEINKYNDLEEIEIVLVECEKKEKEKNEIIKNFKVIKKYKEEIITYNEELKKYKIIFEIKENLNILNKFKKSYNDVYIYNEDLIKIKRDFFNNKKILDKFENIECIKKSYKEVDNMFIVFKKQKKIIDIMNEYKKIKKEISDCERKIKELKTEKKHLLPKGSVCPLCNNIIK